jgi:predicted esterase
MLEFFAPSLPHARFILPTAPTRPVTVNRGAPCPAWYDIETLNSRAHERCEGLPESAARVCGLVAREVASGVAADRVLLAGFSQGGALALYCTLGYTGAAAAAASPVGAGAGAGAGAVAEAAADPCEHDVLAGCAVLSGYLPLPESITPREAVLEHTPIRFFHGTADAVVPFAYGKDAEERVRALGTVSVRMAVYEGLGHSASMREMADVRNFLLRRLPGVGAAAPRSPEDVLV